MQPPRALRNVRFSIWLAGSAKYECVGFPQGRSRHTGEEKLMAVPRILSTVLVALVCTVATRGQESAPVVSQDAPIPRLTPGTARKPATVTTPDKPVPPQIVPLIVPRQTSLQVALDKELRVRKVGQSVSARLVDPVYAFDQLVVPSGSEIRGQVTKIESISGTKRTLAGLDGDFTPTRNIEVTFN